LGFRVQGSGLSIQGEYDYTFYSLGFKL
jgi:hypothetical protein